MNDSPLHAIENLPPQFSCAEARRIAVDSFGLEAQPQQLVSERDQNFYLAAADGSQWVLKIANAAEDPQVTDMQIKALQHIESVDRALPVPRIRPTVNGADRLVLQRDGRSHTVRLVSWLPGDLLDPGALTPAVCRNLGRFLARLGQALADFEYPGGTQSLLWDMREAPALRELLPTVADSGLRQLVSSCLEDFSSLAAPVLGEVREQVIHNDCNPDNVLVKAERPEEIAGVIDFGDVQRAPLIIDVAVAAAYLRNSGGDPLTWIAEFVAGYHATTPLARPEIDLLYDLISTRLATTVVILAWRGSARESGDAYLEKSVAHENSAAPFLRRLRELPRIAVTRRLREVCASVTEASA